MGADARNLISIPHATSQAFGDLTDQLIAGMASERIIDRLEAFRVRHHQREFALATIPLAHELRKPLVEKGAVRKPGQRLVVSKVSELFVVRDGLQAE